MRVFTGTATRRTLSTSFGTAWMWGATVLLGCTVAAILWGASAAGDITTPQGLPFDPEVGVWGTDHVGRDVVRRVAAGGTSLLVALPIGVATTTLVTMVAFVSVQHPRWTRWMFHASASLLAVPAAIIVLTAASVFPSWVAVCAAMVVLGVPQGARQLAAAAAPVWTSGFVDAARVRGESTWSIAMRELGPALLPLVAADAGVRCLAAMQLLIGVHILGLGPVAPAADWALMIRENLPGVQLNGAAVVAPTGAIVVVMVVVLMFFDALSHTLAPPPAHRRSLSHHERRTVSHAACADTNPAPGALTTHDLILECPGSTPIVVGDLEVPRGTVLGITGPSGCGKTTLLAALAGTPTPDCRVTGQVFYPWGDELGVVTTRPWGRRRHRRNVRQRVGIVEQDAQATLDPAWSRRAAIGDGRRLTRERLTRARQLCSQLLLTGNLTDSARVSGGQATRVALVRALLDTPDVLVCDEPTSGLDRAATAAVVEVLRAAAAQGTCVVVSSHDPEFLHAVCDRQVRLGEHQRGEICFPGAAAATTAAHEVHLPSPMLKASKDSYVIDSVDIDAVDGRPLLRGVTLHARPGDFLALIGPSGCGKTTLLRVLLGLHAERTQSQCAHTDCGYAAQDASQALNPALSLRRQIRRAARCNQSTRSAAHQAADAIAAEVGIAEVVSSRPTECSGGQRQRANIARALVSGRKVLLVDEPTTGLDQANSTAIVDVLLRHCANGGTVLAVTHDPLVMAAATRVEDLSRWQVSDSTHDKHQARELAPPGDTLSPAGRSCPAVR
ncbi:hypothetical protein C1Y63_00815 [Corynebacterium sp. 13CS0277]|uniref:ATP-binding cassette domain-containing protein n=1 Tax=Corynebacterium sp. 13CS0277 TaxID=2071994 RepID=UPI000D040DFE|nr:ATP-binding cassette domain-containing protein [Corynebacterium sp. 13CS0277]PRQ12367.1 hypothetical protein C1Y63_00815 [Corynebacterium sp. 13CS0277]